MKAIRCMMALAAALGLASGTAHALEFKSIGAAPAILYDAPSTKGRRVFVAPRGMPVEVVLSYGDWIKVRDADGDLSWVETAALTGRRMLVVTAANARVRATPDDNGATVFTCDKSVLLDLESPTSVAGWFKVRHRDGQTGYVKAGDVWGD
ncbi:MAG: SH3 domain-containing protein [Proteobacteria bacterium]|nr:SH3 domain-containing protein [Pseudomonadota bacterium]